MVLITMIGTEALGILPNFLRAELASFEAPEDLLGIGAQVDTQVIDERDIACSIDLRIERHLGEGGSAVNQRAARIVADTAKDRGADAGQADHGVRITPDRAKRLLELEECCSGQANHLLAAIQEMNLGDP